MKTYGEGAGYRIGAGNDGKKAMTTTTHPGLRPPPEGNSEEFFRKLTAVWIGLQYSLGGEVRTDKAAKIPADCWT